MIKKYLIISFIVSLFSMSHVINSTNSCEEVFTNIYQKGIWGKPWFSGGGSRVEFVGPYMQLLQNFLTKYQIKSVADIGCGDWQFSRYINWSGIDYTGYEVVKHLIELNEKQFGSKTIKFKYADILSDDIAKADLLLCKDLLQHLSNTDIQYFIKHYLPKFQHCLIVNEVNPQDKSSDNPDIKRGETRFLDLTRAPFFVKGEILLVYEYSPGHFKQILWVMNEQEKQ